MSKRPVNLDRDDLDDDLENDYAHASLTDLRRRVEALEGHGAPRLATGDTKRLNAVETRLGKLEQRLEGVAGELGEHGETLRQTRETYARNAEVEAQAALGTLAKAASSSQRRRTPEGVIARASEVIRDPVLYGTVEGYARGGQLAKAVQIVEAAEQKATEAAEDDALNLVERQVDKGAQLAQLSELSGAVANLQNTLESVSKRLTALKRRPAPTPAPATVAKAAGGRHRGAVEYRATPAGLATRLEATIDSPAQVGVISSLLQSGDPAQIEQARGLIEAAELVHESRARRGR